MSRSDTDRSLDRPDASAARPTEATYRATTVDAVVFDHGSRGRLRVEGADSVAFMQRMTAQDVKGLEPGQGVANLLLSSKGRMLALFDTIAMEDGLLLALADGRTDDLVAALERFVFSEDVRLTDVSRELSELLVAGPRAGEFLDLEPGLLNDGGAIGDRSSGVPGRDAGRRDTVVHSIAGIAVRIGIAAPLAGRAYRLLVPAGAAGEVRRHLGARRPGIGEAGRRLEEQLRIEAGLPAPGREIDERFNPLEAGLMHAVSFTKGCFTGQEVIARLRNFHKVQRRLRQVVLDGDAVPPAGSPVSVEAQTAGIVTSAIDSPRHGATLALAYIDRDHAEPGTVVTIDGSRGRVLMPPAATFEAR